MTEYAPAAELPKSDEERRSIARRMGSFITENLSEIFPDRTTQRVAGGLAVLGAVSTAAQFEHWFDHTGMVTEFLQGSGRHFLVGYLGAMTALAKSKAESLHGKLAVGVLGGMGADIITEASQSLIVTGALHHGSLHDIVSFATPKEIFWGNAKDALAAEMAAGGAAAQVIAGE